MSDPNETKAGSGCSAAPCSASVVLCGDCGADLSLTLQTHKSCWWCGKDVTAHQCETQSTLALQADQQSSSLSEESPREIPSRFLWEHIAAYPEVLEKHLDRKIHDRDREELRLWIESGRPPPKQLPSRIAEQVLSRQRQQREISHQDSCRSCDSNDVAGGDSLVALAEESTDQNKNEVGCSSMAESFLSDALRIFPKFSMMLQDMACEWSMARWGKIFQPEIDPQELRSLWIQAGSPEIEWHQPRASQAEVSSFLAWCRRLQFLPNVKAQTLPPRAASVSQESKES